MRSPLMSALRQLVADLRLSRKTNLPLDVVQEQRREATERRRASGISRRALLGGAAAAAGVLALPKAARAFGGNQPDIAIVGAGLAGLAAANKLHQAGVRFTLYESSGRVGGRVYTNDSNYFDDGQITEWGGELIDTGHETMHRLVEEFGLETEDLFEAEPAGSAELYKVLGQYYSKAEADEDFIAMFDTVLADEEAAGYPTTWDDSTAHGRMLDQMNVRQWINSRVPGGYNSSLGRVLDIAYAVEYAADTHDQSALNLLYLLAYQPEPLAFAAFGVSDEKYHIKGGNQRLPKAIAASLPSSALELGTKLVKIKRTSGQRVKLSLQRGGNTFDKTFDWVILALPFAVLREVDYRDADFDQRKDRAIQQLGRGRSAKLQLQFDERIWHGTGPWPGKSNGATYSDVGYQATWEPSRAQAGSAGILNLFSAGSVSNAMKTDVAFATASNHKVRQDAETGLFQIKKVFPGLDWNGKATMSLWHKNPHALHSYAYYRVGQYTAFGGHEGKRQHRVFFAGDHTSQDFQGFMNGAASEGERAAKRLLNKL